MLIMIISIVPNSVTIGDIGISSPITPFKTSLLSASKKNLHNSFHVNLSNVPLIISNLRPLLKILIVRPASDASPVSLKDSLIIATII